MSDVRSGYGEPGPAVFKGHKGTPIYIDLTTGKQYCWRENGIYELSGGVSGAAAWGDIDGDISDQYDLRNALDAKANDADLASVAKSGAYGDLTGKPMLSPIATSGAYADLSGKPALFDGAYSSLSGTPATFAPVIGPGAAQACAGNDARLSDARTPTAHTQASTTISDSTSVGRAVLTAANEAAARTAIQAAAATHSHAQSDITNLTTDLAAKAALSSPTFTGTPAAPTASAGTNTTQLATTAFVAGAVPNSSYRTLLNVAGSHTAGRVAGTYFIGNGDPIGITGTGTLYPPQVIYIAAADYPSVNGVTPKLRIRATIAVNDVAPTGNFTVALHPVTRPSTSGAAGLCIYTVGAAVASSGATQATPAADSHNVIVGSDFALPTDGFYVIGVVTTQTVAASSHVQVSAILQLRNA